MQSPSENAGAPDKAIHASSSSTSVDLRCAITLARVALQTLADLNPEAAASVDNALGYELDTLRVQKDPETLAVIAILSDVKARLLGEEAGVIAEDNAWYID